MNNQIKGAKLLLKRLETTNEKQKRAEEQRKFLIRQFLIEMETIEKIGSF